MNRDKSVCEHATKLTGRCVKCGEYAYDAGKARSVLQFGDEPYTIEYRCGCIEKVRMDTTPQPRERQTYVDYDCSNCLY